MKFRLNKYEIDTIKALTQEFPVDSFEFEYISNNSIGHTLDVIVPTMLKGHEGVFRINITGPKDF